MNAQDDPEERIRQLEQQSANYGAVELGAEHGSGHAATPTAPLPPPAYGAPHAYGTPPPTYGTPSAYGDPYAAPPFGVSYPHVSKKGAPVGLIFGLIAVFVVVVFGVIGAVVWNVTSSTEAVRTRPGGDSSVAGGGGSVDRPETGRPTDSAPSAQPSILPTLPGGASETAPSGGQFSVSGIDENKTVACNDSNVTISGVNNTVALTGHCLSVTVSGFDNQVTVDGADVISASGFDNVVTYLSGDPEINNFGGSNTVERG